MNISLITPVPPQSRSGNRVTAIRWARLLRALGHRVVIECSFSGRRCDAMIALHALRSHRSIVRFAREFPDKPLIVALTGTDLYRDIHRSTQAKASLKLATRLIVLQAKGIDELPRRHREKTRVIHQSVEPLRTRAIKRKGVFEVCVIGHLRPVKDPFRAALAVRRLPSSSAIVVTHAGAALSDSMRGRAETEAVSNGRYAWVGNIPRYQARRLLARSRLLVLTSKMEGGANVISEAIADSVPVLASRIAGSIGLLGEDYPGYFPVGDTDALRELLLRAETEATFYRRLCGYVRRLRPMVTPARERKALRILLAEVVAPSG